MAYVALIFTEFGIWYWKTEAVLGHLNLFFCKQSHMAMHACVHGHPHIKHTNCTHTETRRLREAFSGWSTGNSQFLELNWLIITCKFKLTFQITPLWAETAALPWMAVWAALYSCAKAPGQGSIWILNIQWSRQCLKYTGWMGLPSDHRGSTVHYLLKLSISSLSHSHSPCLRHPDLLSLRLPLSLSRAHFVFISLFISLHLSVCIYLCEYHTLFPGCFFFYQPFLALCLSSSLPLSLSCV